MTALHTAVLDTDRAATLAELSAFFAACPTSVAQQTPGWLRVIEALGVDQPRFIGCRRGDALVGVLPAWRFEGPLGAILTSCAQAGPLGGVACLADADADSVYASLIEAFLALAAEEGCAVATLITNPFWPDRDRCEQRLQPDFVLENLCQVLDLETGLDGEGWPSQATANLRRNLRRATSGTLTVDEEQSAANVAAWAAIHEARHTEIGAMPLPKRLFEAALEHGVPAGVARFFFVRLTESGEMVGGGLYLHHARVIDALMPSIASEHASRGAAFLLGLHSMRWARSQGQRYYNWQPSPPDGGVHRFKSQWGSRDLSYAYLTRVTGEVAPLLQSGVRAVKQGYPFHYAVPFDQIGGRGSGDSSTRRQAWDAAERS